MAVISATQEHVFRFFKVLILDILRPFLIYRYTSRKETIFDFDLSYRLHQNRSVPFPHGRVATMDRHSTLFLDLMVFID
jgi:hypothetical protein